MGNEKIESFLRKAKKLFLEDKRAKVFLSRDDCEIDVGIVEQEAEKPWRIDFYLNKKPTIEEIKTAKSTGGMPVPRIAYCEIHKTTGKCQLFFEEK